MSRSIIISRTDLGLGNLQLSQNGSHYIPDGTFGGGETTQRRTTSESTMVAGRYPSSIVEGSRTGNVTVHVLATLATLQTKVQEVVDAMTQYRFMLAWQFDGLSGTWQCEKADWALGESGTLDDKLLEMHSQKIHFTVPHNRISGF